MNKELRKRIAWMTWHSKEGHIPSAYSILDIVTVLYDEVVNFDWSNPDSPDRDFFILSKGHGCSALYAYLETRGVLTKEDIEDKNKIAGKLATHPDRNKIPTVEASTGSLGNGIGFGLGIALGLKLEGRTNRAYVIVGDAECNEGTVWECALLAAHLKLDNFFLIVDNNQSCNPTLPIGNVRSKFDSFGWRTLEIDGHQEAEITEALKSPATNLKELRPTCIVANTIKGKGVPFMEENYGKWHSKVPNEIELNQIWEAIDNYV